MMVAIYVERRYACWCTKASARLELHHSRALRLAPAVATCRLTLNTQLFIACRWCRVSHVVSCHGRVQYLTANNLISEYICRPSPFSPKLPPPSCMPVLFECPSNCDPLLVLRRWGISLFVAVLETENGVPVKIR